MLHKRWMLVIVLAAVVAPSGRAAEKPKHRWHHKPGEELSLSIDGQTLWTYHFAADAGCPWLHPVKTPGGAVLTDFAPGDHAWHRAIWFSWKFLHGVNYWDWAGRTSGKPAGTTQRVGQEVFRPGDDCGTITIDLDYSAGDKVVLREKREITIGLPRDDGSYTLDWKMTFAAAGGEVVLNRTPPPLPEGKSWGGYGGLSYRGVRGMSDLEVIDSEGRRAKGGHGKAARWLDFSGIVDPPKGTVAGVAVFDHCDNPRHPTPWYVSPTGGMPYFGPALLFHQPYTLPGGKSFTLKYRMLIHPGRRAQAELEAEFKAYCGTAAHGGPTSPGTPAPE